MKINLTKKFKKINEDPLFKAELDEKTGAVRVSKNVLMLKDICLNALLAEFPDEKPNGMENMKRYLLAKKVQLANDIELKAEEVVLIKELVGRAYNSPLVVGQAYHFLEGGK